MNVVRPSAFILSPMFIYFDLGNVVVLFDRERAFRQIAAVAGVTPEQVQAALFAEGLSERYERGAVTSRQFYEQFCRRLGAQPDYAALHHAASDIFQLNDSLIPVIGHLEEAGYRLGILSNTSESHWQFLRQRHEGILQTSFSVHALSYEIGALKPEPKIYQRAAELAGVPPSEIFFCDDIAGHVAGARAAGFDAVVYTTTPLLVAELQKRGVRINY
jgi:putative hydrolase of the HAD superfamily